MGGEPIDVLREERDRTANLIRDEIILRLAELQKRTGLKASRVAVEMIDMASAGSAPKYAIGRVSIDVTI